MWFSETITELVFHNNTHAKKKKNLTKSFFLLEIYLGKYHNQSVTLQFVYLGFRWTKFHCKAGQDEEVDFTLSTDSLCGMRTGMGGEVSVPNILSSWIGTDTDSKSYKCINSFNTNIILWGRCYNYPYCYRFVNCSKLAWRHTDGK